MKIRQISFRAKDFHSNWVYGDLNMLSNIPYIRTDIRQEYAINTNTIGQFIGLKDKNGTQIYEGDIVKYMGHHYTESIGEIFYDKTCCCFSTKVKNGKGYDVVDIDSYLELEVIGNIYDNPELLKY